MVTCDTEHAQQLAVNELSSSGHDSDEDEDDANVDDVNENASDDEEEGDDTAADDEDDDNANDDNTNDESFAARAVRGWGIQLGADIGAGPAAGADACGTGVG